MQKGFFFPPGCTRHPPRISKERVLETLHLRSYAPYFYPTLALEGDVDAQLDQVHQWDGAPRPSALLSRLKRAWPQVGFLTTQIQTLEAERRALWRRREDPVIDQVRQLFTLRGIGVHSAWLYVMACFAWRDFQTPKQVGALAGLTPTP